MHLSLYRGIEIRAHAKKTESGFWKAEFTLLEHVNATIQKSTQYQKKLFKTRKEAESAAFAAAKRLIDQKKQAT